MFVSLHPTPIHADRKQAEWMGLLLARSATAPGTIYMTGAVRSDPS